MDFDLLFMVNKKNSTKSLIIKSLVALKELSNAQLVRVIKKKFDRSISYQAIRQAVFELMDDGVIIKNKKLYSINPSWVMELKNTVEFLEKSITTQAKIKHIDSRTSQIHLKNLANLGYFVLFGLENNYFDPRSKELFFQLDHLWIPFSDMDKRDKLKNIFLENKTTVIIRKNLFIDKMLARWYKKYSELHVGVRVSSMAEYIVQGNCVIQIFMSEGLKKKMNEVYSLQGLLRFDILKQLSDMTFNEYGVDIIITRNSRIAEQVKQNIVLHSK